LLLDAYRAVGLEGIAQVDLDVRQNAHQSLRELGPMAYEVLHAVASRLQREGRLRGSLPSTFMLPGEQGPDPHDLQLAERPPLISLRAAA
jgi:glucosyl-3-phosphoglycerate synthase